MTNTLVGLFDQKDAAQKAVQDLLAAGVDRSLIGSDTTNLSTLGVPAREAGLYAERVQKGGTLVTVQADEAQAPTIQRILDRDGAVDIDAADTHGAGDRLQVVEEQIQVGKREVERGGMRVRTFVTEKPVTAQVTLHEEHVDVQRTKVDRPATGDVFRETTIEMRETAEVPVIAKEVRVVEEISLDKTATDRVETITDTVRRQDVKIERIDGSSASTTDLDPTFKSHLASTAPGAREERYAPAYEYGAQLARDPAFGSSEWSTNETTYRSRWEARNPGTWDEFKGAVQHAFESAKAKASGH